jgi:conjugative relaxase-like TrwC/TraI family protein
MVATIAAGTSAGYYLAQSEYYLGGHEPAGTWMRVGAGLGVSAGSTVERDAFERLHEAIDANGRTLLSNGNARLDRVPGYDITFSAPKSVSVMWALADDDLRNVIERAQTQAVAAALAVLEDHAATSRRGRNGARSEAVKLSVACFQHGEARPTEHVDGRVFADPQLHSHAVILNLARRSDGTVGTLDGRRLFAWKMSAGAAYHLELATGLQKLGFGIDDVGKNGMFELAGLDAELKSYFSARRQEIEAELGEAGLTSAAAPALAGAITKATRTTKDSATAQERFALWREIAAERGHDHVRVVGSARVGGRAGSKFENRTDRARIAAALANVPILLTETESVFEHRHLVAAVASALVGAGASVNEAMAEVDAMIADGRVVELGTDAIGERRYSTPEMIRIERDILDVTKALATRPAIAVDVDLAERLCADGHLSDEQRAAVRAVTKPASVTLIEGAAGSGKTTSLRPIVEAHRAAGYRVIGSATAWRIANQLRDDLGIEARATDSWLAGAGVGKSFLDDRTLLIVDEAGQLSSRQMHAVLQAAERAGAKLLLVGDRKQLQPIGAGGALSIVARATDAVRVDRIVRQREEWARAATADLAAGRTRKAIEAYSERGHVHLHDGGRAAVAALVDLWQAGVADSYAPLLLARTNAQIRDINFEIRGRLRAAGALRGPDVHIGVMASNGKPAELALAVGDEIRFQSRNDRLGVINGTTGMITSIRVHEDEPALITAIVDRREIAFTPVDLADSEGHVRLAHAYASTVYGAQGLTVDRAIVLLDPTFDRHDTYVSLSRARIATEIVADRRLIEAGVRAELPLSERADAKNIDDDRRLTWLGAKLSRASCKGTTLDLMASAELERATAQPAVAKIAARAVALEAQR